MPAFALPTSTDSPTPVTFPLPRGGSVMHEPALVIKWLVRLRWLAILGQVVAIALAVSVAEPQIPLIAIAAVVVLTLGSNVALAYASRTGRVRQWMAPSVILLDVCLLTVLLFCSGGAGNPFSIFYVVHLVMAVVVLGPTWTWVIVAIACLSYALLFRFHVPLVPSGRLPATTQMLGQWSAFALASVWIGYFVGRVAWALRARERELLAVRDEVAQAEQIASLTTLAAGAAHELGTPLGTIAIVAKELEVAATSGGGCGGLVVEDARLIRQEVDRCRKILDRMRLDIVENLHQKVGELSLDDLIDVLREDLSEDERRRLHVVSPVGLKTIRGPIRAIEQAIGVLLRNAFDAAPVREKVNFVIERDAGRTMFRVEDFGQGMPEDVLRRAGQPFFTTKQPGKGMGLGLFLVKLVAKRYGGTFDIESSPGQGTRCVLTIPQKAGSLDVASSEIIFSGGNGSVI